MASRGSRLVTVTHLMLAIVTGLLAGGLHVLAVPRHVHVLAPRAITLPTRGGAAGGYFGMAQGSAVMAVGLVALLVRRLLGVESPVLAGRFSIGVLLVVVGLTVVYRLSLLEAHNHPHLHDEVEHEHIHLHNAPDQVHDHDQTGFHLAESVFNWGNLIGVLPALVLSELDAVLYLVAYLAVSTLGMGGLGSWLGLATRRGRDGDEVLRVARAVGYTLAGLGIAWVVVWWPF